MENFVAFLEVDCFLVFIMFKKPNIFILNLDFLTATEVQGNIFDYDHITEPSQSS